MLSAVKLALRISTTAFDNELNDLIDAARADLGISDIDPAVIATDAAIVKMAVVTYVKAHFGSPDNPERLMASYREQKAQMAMSSAYNL